MAAVDRHDLHRRLDTIFEVRAGEVTGPGGSGKTTLLRTWAPGKTISQVVVLTARARHRDRAVLLGEICGALRTTVGLEIALDRVPADDAVERLAESVDRAGRKVVIVLDDVQQLDDADSLTVVRRLTRVESDSLRVVVSGRYVPEIGLDELRFRGELAMITAADLRLGPAETVAILREILHPDLDDSAVDAIHRQTEGWALGVVLAGLALRNTSDPTIVARDPIDGHRYFDEFFGGDVFAALPAPVQDFLEATSVVDVLDPNLGRALTGRDDAADILHTLEADNYFTEWLGGRPPRYRYHALMQAWLANRLERKGPERVSVLRRRAAEWYEAHGDSATAIEQRLAYGDVDTAITSIIAYGPSAIAEGRNESLRSWILSLPTKTWARDPRLLHLLIETEMRLGDATGLVAVQAVARDSLAHVDGQSRHLYELLVAVQRATQLAADGRVDDAAEAARATLATFDLNGPASTEAVSTVDEAIVAASAGNIAAQLMFAGQWDESEQLCRWVLESFPIDDPTVAIQRTGCLGKLAVIELARRSPLTAIALAREAIALCRLQGIDPMDLAYSEMVLLVASPDPDRAELRTRLERLDGRLGYLRPHACLLALIRAWSYAQSDESAAAIVELADARRRIGEMQQAGMLDGLADRVEDIVELHGREPLLTDRQTEVLARMAAGASRRDVAAQMYLSINTVKTYARQAFRILDVTSLTDAVARCAALGIELVAPGRNEVDSPLR